MITNIIIKIYTFFSSFINKWFQTVSTFIENMWNFFILNLKSYIVLLLIIIINKPFIVIFINFIISFLIRSIFINTIYACDEDSRLLYQQINDIELEPGEPVYLTDLFKWFLEICIWFIEVDPPRDPKRITLIPQGLYPNQPLDDILESEPNFGYFPRYEYEWAIINRPDPKIVKPESSQIEFIQKPATKLIPISVNIETTSTVSSTQAVELPPQKQSYEAWVVSTKNPEPLLFNDPLLKQLYFKLEKCKNADELFYKSLYFVKKEFPFQNWALHQQAYENPASAFNIYLSDLSKKVLSHEEVIAYLHFRCAALSYNKAALNNMADDMNTLRQYYNDNLHEVHQYVAAIKKRI